MSILVHPDKNQEDKDRAQTAFEGKLLIDFPSHLFLGKNM